MVTVVPESSSVEAIEVPLIEPASFIDAVIAVVEESFSMSCLMVSFNTSFGSISIL